jgi:Ca-activated chloride channel family protein
MDDFHFLRPLWLLAFLPVLALWWQVFRRSDSLTALEGVVDPHLLEHLSVGESRKRWFRPDTMLLIFWILLVFAMAGPSWKREPSPFAGEEAGLVILLKVNQTMNATDVQPSRLERAKLKLQDLLEERKGAPSALIVYSGSAHLVMPLTRDERIISAMVEDLTPELMPSEGDSLGVALAMAESLLLRAGVSGSVAVLADTVTTSADLDPDTTSLPVQFLSIQPPAAPVDVALQAAASRLRASVTSMAIDSSDVERVASRARSELTSADPSAEQRWKDSGYALLPLIVLCGLFWSRKGWAVQ